MKERFVWWVAMGSLLVLVAFLAGYLGTGEIWVAMNAAGIVSLIYVIAFVYRVTRPPMPPKHRWISIAVVAVLVVGNTVAWISSFHQSQFQYRTLHAIHKLIFHSSVSSSMHSRGIKAFSQFHTQPEPKKMLLGEIFRKDNPVILPGLPVIDTLSSAQDGVRIFASAISDSEVVLIAQGMFIDGEDSAFQNYDGKVGMTQDRLTITSKRISYEIQN